MPDYEELNKRTRRLMEKVDSYIFSQFQSTEPSVSQKGCLNYIEHLHFDPKTKKIVPIDREIHRAKQATATKSVIEYYNEFLEYKRVELKDSPSMKDYKSLHNALLDYQTTNGVKLTFDIINDKDFFNRFRNFLGTKHKGGKSKGLLNNNTVHKRFSSLKTFLRWIEEKQIFMFKHSLYDYKIQKFSTDFVTLTRDEIKKLEELKIDDPYWQRIIDVFICNCFMSLRFGDLQTFDKGKFLLDEDGDYFYQKRNEKTNQTINVVITPTALRILQKYNFKLPTYTNQYFNRTLFEIFEHYKLFSEKVQKQEIRNGEVVVKYFKKRELITSHTCRRTYITICADKKVGIPAIQSATGHTQLSTLSKYIKRNMNKEQVKEID